MDNNAQECLNKIVDELLGENFYISEPVGGNQANEIITEIIIEKYKKINTKEKLLKYLIDKLNKIN